MADVFSAKKRSQIMSAIKDKGNATTEKRFRTLLKQNKLYGWRVNVTSLPGKPDFIFSKQKIAIFLDGCFWHGCPRCRFKKPKTNNDFWKNKILNNKKRDKSVNRKLKDRNWKVLRIWEHDLKRSPDKALGKLEGLIWLGKNR